MNVSISIRPDPRNRHERNVVHISRSEGNVRTYSVSVDGPSMGRLYAWIVRNRHHLNRQAGDGHVRYTA